MRPTRNRPRHTLLAVAATGAFALTAASLPVLGDHAAATDKVVVVRAGQTLSEIALEVGLTVDELASMNGLADPDRILVGQELVIRSEEPTAPQAAPAEAANPAQTSVSHRVASGETLSGIAMSYGTTVSAIVQANGIANPSFIRSGQVLAIPGAAPKPAAQAQAAKPAPSTVTHRVAAGESLWGIAQRYGTTVSAIVQANGIANPSFIRSGQVLAIPGAGPVSGGSSAPASGGTATASIVSAAMDPLMAATVAQRDGIGRIIASEAGRQGVPVAFAMAVAWQESGWRPGVVSSAGAIGVMQLLPATGNWVADTMLGAPVNLWDPASNVRAGVALLKHYLVRYGGDRSLALAAYYQGQAATDRHGIYPVSRPYIGSILSLERMFGG